MSQLAITANDIDVSGLTLDVSLSAEWLTAILSDADVSASAPGHLTARLSRSGSEIIVRGWVKASVSTPCARCLRPAAVDVDAELSLMLRPAAKVDLRPAARVDTAQHGHGRDHAAGQNGVAKKGAKAKEPEYEFSAEEADTDTYDGETVVLDPFVREAILLEMPNFPLCSEACPGIGPAASEGEADVAASPAIDPRLAPLGALREKLGQMPPSASEERPDSASSSPAKPGTPKKKTKKE
jgi:uncharacterized protein